MGLLRYDGTTVQFDDQLLTHLQIVIIQKFRRDESFLMSWRDGPAVGNGRGSIWLTPALPIYFKFHRSRVSDINRDWLETLAASANSPRGLIIHGPNGQPTTSSP